ncbi:hypothetical protein D3C80_1275900 [compost metagenome]
MENPEDVARSAVAVAFPNDHLAIGRRDLFASKGFLNVLAQQFVRREHQPASAVLGPTATGLINQALLRVAQAIIVKLHAEPLDQRGRLAAAWRTKNDQLCVERQAVDVILEGVEDRLFAQAHPFDDGATEAFKDHRVTSERLLEEV